MADIVSSVSGLNSAACMVDSCGLQLSTYNLPLEPTSIWLRDYRKWYVKAALLLTRQISALGEEDGKRFQKIWDGQFGFRNEVSILAAFLSCKEGGVFGLEEVFHRLVDELKSVSVKVGPLQDGEDPEGEARRQKVRDASRRCIESFVWRTGYWCQWSEGRERAEIRETLGLSIDPEADQEIALGQTIERLCSLPSSQGRFSEIQNQHRQALYRRLVALIQRVEENTLIQWVLHGVDPAQFPNERRKFDQTKYVLFKCLDQIPIKDLDRLHRSVSVPLYREAIGKLDEALKRPFAKGTRSVTLHLAIQANAVESLPQLDALFQRWRPREPLLKKWAVWLVVQGEYARAKNLCQNMDPKTRKELWFSAYLSLSSLSNEISDGQLDQYSDSLGAVFSHADVEFTSSDLEELIRTLIRWNREFGLRILLALPERRERIDCEAWKRLLMQAMDSCATGLFRILLNRSPLKREDCNALALAACSNAICDQFLHPLLDHQPDIIATQKEADQVLHEIVKHGTARRLEILNSSGALKALPAPSRAAWKEALATLAALGKPDQLRSIAAVCENQIPHLAEELYRESDLKAKVNYLSLTPFLEALMEPVFTDEYIKQCPEEIFSQFVDKLSRIDRWEKLHGALKLRNPSQPAVRQELWERAIGFFNHRNNWISLRCARQLLEIPGLSDEILTWLYSLPTRDEVEVKCWTREVLDVFAQKLRTEQFQNKEKAADLLYEEALKQRQVLWLQQLSEKPGLERRRELIQKYLRMEFRSLDSLFLPIYWNLFTRHFPLDEQKKELERALEKNPNNAFAKRQLDRIENPPKDCSQAKKTKRAI